MRLFAAYLAGLLFGLGIAISGMMNPAKVLNFLDIFGMWDPSLAFVMGGALVTTFIGYRLVLRRTAPMFESSFALPRRHHIDRPLLAGSAIFGVGWAIAGFCPGGALPALGTGRWEVVVFMGALIVGVLIAKGIQSALQRPQPALH